MRARIVNSRWGAAARAIRDRWEVQRAAAGLGEEVGTLANDRAARLLLERLCLPGRTFVDVGAHIGSVIDGVRRHSRPGAIHAVEAIPEKAAALKRRFPGVVVHTTAVGETAGQARFFVAAHSGYSSLDPTLSSRGQGVREIAVAVERLDALVPSQGVDVVKIDVEGAELGVLRGAEAMIAASRPSLLFESGPEAMDAFPKNALWEWLDARDYAILVPNRVPHLDPGLTRDGFGEAHLFPRRTTNYWAIARERREEVRARARDVLRIA